MITSPWSPLGIVEQVEELDRATLNTYAIAGDNITFELSAERNYTPNGNVIVNDNGVASGFSARTDYLKVNYQFAPSSSPWKMFWKVKTGSSHSARGVNHCVQGSAWSGVDKRHVQVVEYMGNWAVGLSSDGSTWNIGEVLGTHTVQFNTDYWLTLEFTGTNYIFNYSLDGETWVEDVNIASTTPVYQQSGSSNYNALGSSIAPAYADCSWEGDIYLEDCYYEIDGVEVWRAFVNSGKYAINSSSPAGTLTNTSAKTNSLGVLGTATGVQCTAVGAGAQSDSDTNNPDNVNFGSVAIGYNAKADRRSVAIGADTGYGAARARANQTIAIGSGAFANQQGGIAIGAWNNATGGNDIAIGNGSNTGAAFAIQLGKGTNNTANSLKVGLSASDNYTLLESTGMIPGERYCKSEGSAPTTSSVGSVGTLWVDTSDSNAVYMCVAIGTVEPDTTIYTWKKITA